MFIYLVMESYGDGCTYSGETIVEAYDSKKKASDHLFGLVADDTFLYDVDPDGIVTYVKPSKYSEQAFSIEAREVK